MKDNCIEVKFKILKKLRNLKNKNLFFLLLWSEYRIIKERINMKRYSDIKAISSSYYSWSGRYPNLKNPILFSEKIQWIKLNYKNPLMRVCSDKYEVRNYIKSIGYKNLLNELLFVFENVDDIVPNNLPKKFILKATHGSGWNIVCKDKNKINWFFWRLIMKSWYRRNYYWVRREWAYNKIKPRIVCEKYLEDSSGGLRDYKFYCFNGKPEFVQVDINRSTENHQRGYYDLHWKLLPFITGNYIPLNVDLPKPEHFTDMVEIARNLSSPFIYVRVDLYNVRGEIFFGELTFYPAGGKPNFLPFEYDLIVGNMLKINNKLNIFIKE